MRKTNRVSCLIFVLVGILFSCHKDSATSSGSVRNHGIVPVPQNLLDYGFFKPGTWWVYQDSVSGKYDSLYVTSASSGWDTIRANAGLGYTGIFGWFDFKYSNSYGFYYEQYCHASYGLNSGKIPIFLNKNGTQYYSGEGTLMFSIFTNGLSATYGHGTAQIEEDIYCKGIQDSFIVKGVYYHNTVAFYNTWQPAEKKNRTMTHFGKNIGIIEKGLLDSNQNWQLVKYNIVQ